MTDVRHAIGVSNNFASFKKFNWSQSRYNTMLLFISLVCLQIL